MPNLDVSRVLTSRFFSDSTLQRVRNTQTEGTDGRAVNAPTTTNFAGVVTNDKGDLLVREDAGSRIIGTVTIHTKFQLQDGRTGLAPDNIIWCGRTYVTEAVSDYSTYGTGFYAVTASLLPIDGGAQ